MAHGTVAYSSCAWSPLTVMGDGFPSDHALMAAALLAAVGLPRLRWTLLVLPLAVLVEWARVGAGLHHPIDVVGSDACVALGVIVAVAAAPVLTHQVLPRVPRQVSDLVAAPDQTVG